MHFHFFCSSTCLPTYTNIHARTHTSGKATSAAFCFIFRCLSLLPFTQSLIFYHCCLDNLFLSFAVAFELCGLTEVISSTVQCQYAYVYVSKQERACSRPFRFAFVLWTTTVPVFYPTAICWPAINVCVCVSLSTPSFATCNADQHFASICGRVIIIRLLRPYFHLNMHV